MGLSKHDKVLGDIGNGIVFFADDTELSNIQKAL